MSVRVDSEGSPVVSLRMVLERLRKLCVTWGGSLEPVGKKTLDKLTEESADSFSDAPFSDGLGVAWEAKRIVYVPGLKDVTIAGIIHEMGHVFACTKPPETSEEVDFLGWEYVLARRLRYPLAQWLTENKDYVVTEDGFSIGNLLPGSQWASDRKAPKLRPLFRERVKVATDLGLIVAGRPVAIR